jgi:hypothetical protein
MFSFKADIEFGFPFFDVAVVYLNTGLCVLIPPPLTICFDMLVFDAQVLSNLHQAVIPHLSNPIMLWYSITVDIFTSWI